MEFTKVFALAPGVTLALLAALGLGLALRLGWIKGRALSGAAAGALAAAVAWSAAMLPISRLVEYAAPLAILAAGLVARDALGAMRFPTQRSRLKALAAAGVLALALALNLNWNSRLVIENYLTVQETFYCQKTDVYRGRYFDGATKWLRENAPPHSTVLNFHWDDFPELFYSAPDYNYVVGLDPTFLSLYAPEKARALEDMRTGQRALDFAQLAEMFGAKYMLMRKYRAANFPLLKSGAVRPVFLDAEAVIYQLR